VYQLVLPCGNNGSLKYDLISPLRDATIRSNGSEKCEDTNGVFRSRKSKKGTQYNGQNNKDRKQHTTLKLTIELH